MARPDVSADDYRARIEAGADEVESIRLQLQDAIDRRNLNIVAAVENHAGSIRQIAGWADLTKPSIENILART